MKSYKVEGADSKAEISFKIQAPNISNFNINYRILFKIFEYYDDDYDNIVTGYKAVIL